MQIKFIPYIFLLLLLCPAALRAQSCTCTNCPDDIPAFSSPVFNFEITGASLNNLADPAQGVCGVFLSFEHDFIWNVEMTLTSPGGQQVTLIGPDFSPPLGSFTGFANWNINFEQCTEVVLPDPGFNPIWSNIQSWLAAGIYTGSYYPNSGCLEDFNTGSVNGIWTITVDNTNPFYTGELLDFQVIFCNTEGMGCFVCGADGGALLDYDTISLCQGDTLLAELDIPPLYSGIAPDSLSYGYLYGINQNGMLLSWDSIPDLENYLAGTYSICGLSYLYADSLAIPDPTGLFGMDSIAEVLNNASPLFCGDLSDTCVIVQILSNSSTIADTICEGDTYIYNGTPLSTTGEYEFVFPSTIGCTDSTVLIQLTVLDSVQQYIYESICQGESYVIGGSTYTTSGVYANTFTAANGCDSTIILSLTVNPNIINNIAATICQGESYTVGTSVYTVSGMYSNTLTASNTCDSIVNLSLTVNPNIINNIAATICQGESYTVGSSVYTVSGMYSNTLIASNSCDSIVNLSLTVNPNIINNIAATICQGESYIVGTSVYTASGMYSNTLTAFNTCDSIVNLSLTVNPNIINNIAATICQGESYMVGTSVYTVSGMYSNTLTASNTCDSIVNLSLTVNPNIINNITATICQGESYIVGTSVYTASGMYSNTFTAFNTCDSIVNLSLTVNPNIVNNITATICNGATYTVGSSVYSLTGLYSDTLLAFNTCDSIINLNLTVADFYETNLTEVICEGESIVIGSSTYNTTGFYTNTFLASNGCDSIVNLALTVNQAVENNISATICTGASYTVGSSVYTLSGLYSDTLSSFNNCDSVIQLNLTVADFYETNLTEVICVGESIVIGNSTYATTGFYTNSFLASNGCDSIVNLTLTVNQAAENNITATICEGTSYIVGTSVYTLTGLYSDTLPTFNSCDSIINLNLTVADFYETNLTEVICEGESIVIGNSTYATTGFYTNSFLASNGCDSIVNLTLTVNQAVENNITATICTGASYTVGSSVYSLTGLYSDTLSAFNTCDSIINLNLTVADFYETNLTEVICEGESIVIGSSTYSSTGFYTNNFLASNGCDSIVNLTLTVNQAVENNITATICEGTSYTVGTSVYTLSGLYSDTLSAFNTCDSIINLNLTVADFYETNLTEVICVGESIVIGNSTYATTGFYTNSFLASNGCDSIVNLTLTVNQAAENNITATICEGTSYTVGTSVYTLSGLYSDTLSAFNTCDSIVNLNLTVADFYETNLTEVICEGESIVIGNSTYTTTGFYTNTFLASNGCDSIVNLTLTVNQAVENNITATICTGASYTVGTSVYSLTGLYSDTLPAFNSCDSIINLNLTVADFYETNLTEVICEGESTVIGNSTYTTTGFYTNTFLASNGCDSIVNLSLTVSQAMENNITATICEGTSYNVGTSVYTLSGLYSDTLSTFNSCDSIINLNLTVADFYETNLTEVICEGESIVIGNSTYTTTGFYTNTFLASNGCDSIVNLSLMVNPNVVNNITATICQGTSYTVGTSVYTTSGMYSNSLTAFNTCDSIVNLNLTVADFYETNLTEVICEGESIVIGNSTYSATGFYTNTFLANNGCDSIVNLDLSVLNPQLNIAVPDTLDCASTELTLTANLISSGLNGQIEFLWTHLTNGGDGITGVNDEETVLVQKSGLYQIIVTETVQGIACTQSQTVMVLQDTTPTIALINTQNGTSLNCSQNSLILTGQDSQVQSPADMIWMLDNQVLGSGITIEVMEPGIYSLVVSSLVNHCVDTAFIVVEQNIEEPLAVVQVADTLTCLNESITLDGIGSSSGTGIVYEWSTGDGSILSGSATLFPEINEAGTYTLLVTNENNSCTATAQVLVFQETGGLENVMLDFENPSCQGLSDGWIALFDTDGGIRFSLDGVATESPIWRDLSGGSYQILVEDAVGCQWDTLVNLIAPNSVMLWLEDDIEVQLGDSVSFEAQINLPLAAIDTLIWSPAGLLDCDSCYEQHYTPLETILFTARVIDENGCEASDDILIRVIKDRLIYIPNAFSPNSDGNNDLLMIHGGSGVMQINTFQIYDRYGALVYRADNFQPNHPAYSWDGYHMGKPLNPAVFAFYAEVLFTDGRKQLYKGDITIIK